MDKSIYEILQEENLANICEASVSTNLSSSINQITEVYKKLALPIPKGSHEEIIECISQLSGISIKTLDGLVPLHTELLELANYVSENYNSR